MLEGVRTSRDVPLSLYVIIAIVVVTMSALGCADDTPNEGRSLQVLLPPDVLASAPPSPTITASPGTAEATGQITETPINFSPEAPALGAPVDDDLLPRVDKENSLPSDYVPSDLQTIPSDLSAPGFGGMLFRGEALQALSDMLVAAQSEGLTIGTRSAYRSYAEQEYTYQYWVSVLGGEEADRVSAHPGHSEHQLGTAVDLTSTTVGWGLVESFGGTLEGQWLNQHAYEFGFALSYPEGAEHITGYAYEPWHYRYIGRDAAGLWKDSGLTLKEFLAGR